MNTQQLEARSNTEREEVEDTLGQLRKRLSPGQLVDEVLAYTKDGGGEFLTNLGRQATNNPLPVSLIGAGLAWFLFSKGGSQFPSTSPASNATNGTDGKKFEAKSSGMGSEIADAAEGAASAITRTVSGANNAMHDGISTASDRVSEGAGAVSDAISGASQSVKDGLTRSASAIGEAAGSARRNAGELTTGAAAFLKDQPLILLGAGLALGAAVGAALPATEVENEVLGETSSELKSHAKEVATSKLDKTKAAGEHLYGKVKESLSDEIGHLSDGVHTGHVQIGADGASKDDPAA